MANVKVTRNYMMMVKHIERGLNMQAKGAKQVLEEQDKSKRQ